MFVALVCSVFFISLRATENTEHYPSLHDVWTSCHISRADRTQTTIDTLFSLVRKYKTVTDISEEYVVDLTPEDRELLHQFAESFTADKNSYKKKHPLWILSPAYYFRKQKARRAKKLNNLFPHIAQHNENISYVLSIGTAGHEIPTLFSIRRHNNHVRTAITE